MPEWILEKGVNYRPEGKKWALYSGRLKLSEQVLIFEDQTQFQAWKGIGVLPLTMTGLVFIITDFWFQMFQILILFLWGGRFWLAKRSIWSFQDTCHCEIPLEEITHVSKKSFGRNKNVLSVQVKSQREHQFFVGKQFTVWIDALQTALMSHDLSLEVGSKDDLPEWVVGGVA